MVSMTPIEIPTAQRGNLYGGGFEAAIYDSAMDLPNVVKSSVAFTVDCRWYIEGVNTSFFDNPANSWRLQLVYESIGGGPEGVLPTGGPVTVPFSTNTKEPAHPTRLNYTGSVTVPASQLALGGNDQRAFHLTALLIGEDSASVPFLAASYDLGVIQAIA
jgi:hypothetical protein